MGNRNSKRPPRPPPPPPVRQKDRNIVVHISDDIPSKKAATPVSEAAPRLRTQQQVSASGPAETKRTRQQPTNHSTLSSRERMNPDRADPDQGQDKPRTAPVSARVYELGIESVDSSCDGSLRSEGNAARQRADEEAAASEWMMDGCSRSSSVDSANTFVERDVTGFNSDAEDAEIGPNRNSPSLVDDGYYHRRDADRFEVTSLAAAPAPSPSEPSIRWRRGELLGSGAFGRVYQAFDVERGELIAVKQVDLLGGEGQQLDGKTAELLSELEAEISLMSRLQHPNIVRYLGSHVEFGREGDQSSVGVLSILLEFVAGGSVARLLKRFGAFDEPVVRSYARQVLQGLVYLHDHRIVHRDIKGGNILVDRTGQCKLADFGASTCLASLTTGGGGTHSNITSLRGTPNFMAPEVIKQQPYGRKADIWSMGCTVVEMLTGRPPWSNFETPIAVMYHIASSSDAIPPLPDGISPCAVSFVRACLTRDPVQRPTARQLLSHPFLLDDASRESAARDASAALRPSGEESDRVPPEAAPAAKAEEGVSGRRSPVAATRQKSRRTISAEEVRPAPRAGLPPRPDDFIRHRETATRPSMGQPSVSTAVRPFDGKSGDQLVPTSPLNRSPASGRAPSPFDQDGCPWFVWPASRNAPSSSSAASRGAPGQGRNVSPVHVAVQNPSTAAADGKTKKGSSGVLPMRPRPADVAPEVNRSSPWWGATEGTPPPPARSTEGTGPPTPGVHFSRSGSGHPFGRGHGMVPRSLGAGAGSGSAVTWTPGIFGSASSSRRAVVSPQGQHSGQASSAASSFIGGRDDRSAGIGAGAGAGGARSQSPSPSAASPAHRSRSPSGMRGSWSAFPREVNQTPRTSPASASASANTRSWHRTDDGRVHRRNRSDTDAVLKRGGRAGGAATTKESRRGSQPDDRTVRVVAPLVRSDRHQHQQHSSLPLPPTAASAATPTATATTSTTTPSATAGLDHRVPPSPPAPRDRRRTVQRPPPATAIVGTRPKGASPSPATSDASGLTQTDSRTTWHQREFSGESSLLSDPLAPRMPPPPTHTRSDRDREVGIFLSFSRHMGGLGVTVDSRHDAPQWGSSAPPPIEQTGGNKKDVDDPPLL